MPYNLTWKNGCKYFLLFRTNFFQIWLYDIVEIHLTSFATFTRERWKVAESAIVYWYVNVWYSAAVVMVAGTGCCHSSRAHWDWQNVTECPHCPHLETAARPHRIPAPLGLCFQDKTGFYILFWCSILEWKLCQKCHFISLMDLNWSEVFFHKVYKSSH